MSIVYCHACDSHIDTDYNAEHFDVDDVEITIKKFPESYEVQIIQGDAINQKKIVNDEYDVGEVITNFVGNIKLDCEL